MTRPARRGDRPVRRGGRVRGFPSHGGGASSNCGAGRLGASHLSRSQMLGLPRRRRGRSVHSGDSSEGRGPSGLCKPCEPHVRRAIGATLAPQVHIEVLRITNMEPERLTELQLPIVSSPTGAFEPAPAIGWLLTGIPGEGLASIGVVAADTWLSARAVGSPLFVL